MDKEEVLKKVQAKKDNVGEMERTKINRANWISVIATGVVAIAFIIVFGCLRMKAVCFAIGAICFVWPSVFYFCQYFIAKRPVGVLVGAIFESFGFLVMLTNFILSLCGVI